MLSAQYDITEDRENLVGSQRDSYFSGLDESKSNIELGERMLALLVFFIMPDEDLDIAFV